MTLLSQTWAGFGSFRTGRPSAFGNQLATVGGRSQVSRSLSVRTLNTQLIRLENLNACKQLGERPPARLAGNAIRQNLNNFSGVDGT
jgi:hypothetical protein